ncbi:NTP transferase domain-containing protein [bacterium]|nr:NTP transferase domain-containing protein [bacterium]
MKGMVLAAGFGTRLAGHIPELPKPLVHAGGRPMISLALETLHRSGCSEVIVNLHHRAKQIASWLEQQDFGMRLTLVHERDILGTGGGILNAAEHLAGDGSFLVCNADTFTAQDLRPMLARHEERGALATLLVNERPTSRPVLFDRDWRFLGKQSWFDETQLPPADAMQRGFCGVHVISPALFRTDFPRGFADIFDIYRQAMAAGAELQGFESAAYWSDLGTPERIADFEQWLRQTGTH